MVALIVYLVVGLVAQAICFPIAISIRGHKKFHNAMSYMIIATKVLNDDNYNMTRFKRCLFIVLYNVAWPYKLYNVTKYLIPLMDKAYIDELELLTQKEEL